MRNVVNEELQESREEQRRQRSEERARRESRRLNYEYRPTAVRDMEYARRLEAGFRMMRGG